MFWGTTLSNKKRYSHEVDESYHVTMAALEPSAANNNNKSKFVQVMVQHKNQEFLLCTLDGENNLQVKLDLLFVEGEKVTFFLKGEGTVHLTGYLIPEDEDDFNLDEMSDEEEIEAHENMKANMANALQAKRKADKVPENASVGKKSKFAEVKAPNNEPVAKNQKQQKQEKQKTPLKSSIPEIDISEDDSDMDSDIDSEMDEEAIAKLMKEKGLTEEDFDTDSELDESEDDDEGDSEDEVPQLGKGNQKNQTPGKKGAQNQQQNKKPQQDQSQGKIKTPKQGNTPKQINTPKQGSNTPKQQLNQKQQNTPNFKESVSKTTPKSVRKTLKGGIIVEDIHTGNGPIAENGKFVHVKYVGKLSDNTVFDQTQNKPFSFKLGKGEVIKGWEIGIQGMQVGGKRKLTIPPKMGYGGQRTGKIAPNSTLHFEVELKAVS